MEQSNQSKKVLLSVIGVAILVVAVVGVSFAFFNYTRTGSANTVQTGHIYFTSSNSDFSVSDLFPVAAATAETANDTVAEQVIVGTVTITGKTTYDAGLDYRVSAQNVDMLVNGKTLPLSVYVTETANPEGITNNHVYSYNAGASTTVLPDNALLASGHINGAAENSENVSHTITIRAYIDSSKIAITDTPVESTDWVNGRTVYNTTEWNNMHELNNDTASFKIRVESAQNGGSYEYATAPSNTGGVEYVRS